ncbi:PmbA protein [Rubricella aquisinus]|uniref:PmbA protein n=1 Tax=Rubricella aquisinus TaxID=2028108 RepID=A0A840WPG8_9RHOB|nr:TldD/PmbA family protein [Rubricella aquisinus]MBB5516939.1 PmbA protein [Rubricella aquisinus]
MTQNLSDLTEALLSAAKRHGADAADAMAVTNDSISVDVLKGALEQAGRSEATEIGLRVLIGQRSASVSGSDLRAETIDTMAERAVQMARLAPEDPYIGLADPAQLTDRRDAEGLDLVDDHAPAPADLEAAAAEAEAAALAVKGVAQVSSASAAFGRTVIHLAMTNGFSGGYARTGHSLSCVAISGEGLEMERDYHFDSRIHHADLISPQEIGRIAGERAIARAKPRKPATGTYPVLYDERVASGLIGHLVSAVNGAAIARGASWLKDAMGEAVLPDHLSLTEDPLRPRVGGSKPFDAEGLPVARRDLVKDGVLQGWTLDLATARKLGLTSTGSASRGVAGAPSPGVTNLALTQGDISRDQMIRDMGTGLMITSLIGSTINPNTGDYSRGASGFWIENGEIAYPVNECTIAGNLRDMLRRIVPANDARTHVGRVVPSLLVDGMTLAGG